MAQAQQNPPREYETIYVLRPDITKEGAEKVSNRVAEVMQREGGTLSQVESWGRRTLAFPVANHRRAYYIYLKYLGGGEVVSELERNFRMLDGVLKYQTVKLRDEVDASQVAVDPEAVEFEAIEPPVDEEAEETLAEQLGLQEPPQREARPENGGETPAAENKTERERGLASGSQPVGEVAETVAKDDAASEADDSKEDSQ